MTVALEARDLRKHLSLGVTAGAVLAAGLADCGRHGIAAFVQLAAGAFPGVARRLEAWRTGPMTI
jgi:hypothetical protein